MGADATAENLNLAYPDVGHSTYIPVGHEPKGRTGSPRVTYEDVGWRRGKCVRFETSCLQRCNPLGESLRDFRMRCKADWF